MGKVVSIREGQSVILSGAEGGINLVVESCLAERIGRRIFLVRDDSRRAVLKVFSPFPQKGSLLPQEEIEVQDRLARIGVAPCVYGGYQNQVGAYAILMEYLEGVSLDKIPRCQPKAVYNVALGILNVLSQVHKEGIILRDIKPEHFFVKYLCSFLDVVPEFCLIDFGLVAFDKKHFSGELRRRFIGTKSYYDPSLIVDRPNLSSLSSPSRDLFAVGIVLLKLLLGYIPENPSNAVPSFVIGSDGQRFVVPENFRVFIRRLIVSSGDRFRSGDEAQAFLAEIQLSQFD